MYVNREQSTFHSTHAMSPDVGPDFLNVHFSFCNLSRTDWASLQAIPGCAVQLFVVCTLPLICVSSCSIGIT
jgi:hypothetical protein